MNFLVDAQLPRRMAAWLIAAGCDAIHTLDLPDGNRTTDQQISDVAGREQRVVVTKDADFVDGHLLRGRPAKLLLISTGNISNRDLESLMVPLKVCAKTRFSVDQLDENPALGDRPHRRTGCPAGAAPAAA